ncbi:hypothetical protein FHL15_004705 [Xylaria flabelliformis]|uniref:DNA-directed RNA polymerase II subunit RPB9-like zinc ribbon domain-containing protein n=1 Tax=Xylaria flabelliformis TaxID=2512241 RepID=A0A553I2X8_9PEZI|nr:hypothetical protein FHL15_004705 [Xylaria flabelliformis]
MATPQSTASGDVPKNNNLEQITFRFCSECSNMLYPKEDEDSHKLMFTCRTCQYTEEATSSCVFRHVLNSAAGETAGVTQDVGSDPTVCGPVFSDFTDSPDAAAAAAATASDDDSPALCLRCGITLLHCDRCQDPASVTDYNKYVLQNSDFAIDRCYHYVQLASAWGTFDEETKARCVDCFMSFSDLRMPPSSEQSIGDYLTFGMALDSEADPPEALGMDLVNETYDF